MPVLFAYEEVEEDIAPTDMATILNTLKNQIKLPVDDDFIYEKFGIPKPDNYDAIKSQSRKKCKIAAKQCNKTIHRHQHQKTKRKQIRKKHLLKMKHGLKNLKRM
jgi:DNA polymerase sigma